MPKIGTAYIELSDEGVYLDSASCARLGAFLEGKEVAKPKIGEPPVETGKQKDFPALLMRYEQRTKRKIDEYNDFTSIKFVWAHTGMRGTRNYDEHRIFAVLEWRDGIVYADVITGTLFSKDGDCHSSAVLYLSKLGRAPLKEERKGYIKKKQDFSRTGIEK